MYLTRTAGIETNQNGQGNGQQKCILPALRELKHLKVTSLIGDNRMYLTRTAGIETTVTHTSYINFTICILPALRELKHRHAPAVTCTHNVSYPHCGN